MEETISTTLRNLAHILGLAKERDCYSEDSLRYKELNQKLNETLELIRENPPTGGTTK